MTKKDKKVPSQIYLGSKYEFIRKDIVLKEIERRYKEFDGKTGDITTASRLAYLDVLSFLDTIESEKPMQEGLEEELDRFIASGKSVTVEDCGTYKVSYHDFKKVARHFAEWGAEHLKK